MRRRELIGIGSIAAVWPLAARAQAPAKVHRMAFVHPSAPADQLSEKTPWYRPFFEELRRRGYSEGQNLIVDRYSGDGQSEPFPELTRVIVDSKPEVIFVIAGRMAAYLKTATTTIPIVVLTADPVVLGLASNLARPGENVTGVVVDAGIELETKRLDLLRQVAPNASKIGYLIPHSMWDTKLVTPLREAASSFGLTLVPALLESPAQEHEFRRVFATLKQNQVDALMVAQAAEISAQARLVVELAASDYLPTLYPDRRYPEAGGLMSYGNDQRELFRHAAVDIDQILKGENAGGIPFYRATTFELVINETTATALGVQIPPIILGMANDLID